MIDFSQSRLFIFPTMAVVAITFLLFRALANGGLQRTVSWLRAVGRPGGRAANDQLRLHCDLGLAGIGFRLADTAQKDVCSNSAHLAQGLADRGQAWILVGGTLNVV